MCTEYGPVCVQCDYTITVADLHSKILDVPGVQIISISCNFGENLAKSYVGAHPRKVSAPPRGNPGSATE